MSQQSSTTSKQVDTKKLVIIVSSVIVALLVAIAIAIAAVFYVVNQSTKDIQKVSNNFLVSLQNHDINAGYEIASTQFKQDTDMQQLATLYDQLQGAYTDSSFKIISRRVESNANNDFAAIVYQVSNDRGSFYARVTLQKENDTWKVLNFRSSQAPLEAVIE